MATYLIHYALCGELCQKPWGNGLNIIDTRLPNNGILLEHMYHTVQSLDCNIRKSTLHLNAMVSFQIKKLFNTKCHF